VLFPIFVLCVLDAEGLMVLLYSSRYAEGASFLRILVCGFGLSYTFLITFCAMLMARGLSLLAAGITLTLIPLEVLFHILAIPLYGGIGAAVAATLALTLGAVSAGVFVYRKMGALMVPAVLPKVALATACMAGVWALLEPTGPMLIIGHIGLLGLYALILALLGELTWEDLQPLMFWRSAGVSEALSDP
jgi:O-antigen/teichoic acid export membrane protein